MGKLSDYLVKYSGLSLGTHRFSFEIGDSFFEAFDNAELKQAEGIVDLDLVKHSSMLELFFDIRISVGLSCDRCLVEGRVPLRGEQKLIVKFGEATGEEPDDIVVLPQDDGEIQVGQYLYEFIMLMLPLQRVLCDMTGDKSLCDNELLAKLSELSGEEKDETEEKSAEIDPRWQKLKDLGLN